MIELDRTLTDLARVESGSEPIVSLYLDVRWSDEQQRDRVRLFVQDRARRTLAHYPPGSPGRDGLARTLGRAQEYVAGLLGQAYEAEKGGFALFACESLNLWRPLHLARPFENELCTDRVPHLMQFARLRGDDVPTIVVVPSPAGGDVYQVSLGELAIAERIRGFVPRNDADIWNAGTARPRRQYDRVEKNERRTEHFVQRNRRLAAVEVEKLFEQRPGSVVVLVGTSEAVAAFEGELPERLRERIVARLPRPGGWESSDEAQRAGVADDAAKAVRAHEDEEEDRLVDRVVGEALRGGVGVIGPEDVLAALTEGRVHTLVIEAGLNRTGWQRQRCGALGEKAESAESCPYCGGELNVLENLSEVMVARALRQGARVEVVTPRAKLHSYRGVGALLRQTSPTGLRGASPRWPTSSGANQG